jgi:hydroxymethylpyrimidine/phosphomethylpyrimidine kinase
VSPGRGVLVVGGSDPSGCAGVQVDLRVLADHGCRAMAALTALTVQGPRGVRAVHPVAGDLVEAQVRAVIEECPPAVLKIGMLGTGEAVSGLLRGLLDWRGPVVLDPVLAASAGPALLDDRGREALDLLLARQRGLLTPNLPEAAALGIGDPAAYAAARGWAVLCKGGHGAGPLLVDHLCLPGGEERRWQHPRRAGLDLRGTGCRLASAIAAARAAGQGWEAAVDHGIAWLQADLRPHG